MLIYAKKIQILANANIQRICIRSTLNTWIHHRLFKQLLLEIQSAGLDKTYTKN